MSNLTETMVREKLKVFFDGYAIGNKGYADVSYVAINGTTIEFKAKIVNKQTVDNPLNIVVFHETQELVGKFDVMHPNQEEITFEIKQLGTSLKIDLRQVIQELVTLV